MNWPEILPTCSLVYLHPALPNKFTPASLTRPIRLRNRRQVLANMVFYNRAMISVVLVLGGVSALRGRSLTRAWPGSQPNAIDRGGAYNAPPPQANSQTNDRSETGEAALERSRRDGSKALLKFFLKGHVSGQGQVKGQNWAFQHFGSQNRQLDSNRPKLGRKTLKG